jgi:hypothetical protein
MIALRFLPRENWEPQLRYYRCSPLLGLGKLNTAEWWKAEWGHVFTVPIETTGCCHQEAFQRLITSVVSTAPTDMTFPGPGYEEPSPEIEDDKEASG